ncbi:hypothetical protein DE146DRAFT_666974 [Phaeosphaeria sp. MPI-PUGE-AT-0046c]|nr:hypothetical protein DE146DRAFT_666974 [Phaeosphaeria sp. MPI-PUGE-AT-0046c]
MMYKVLLSLHVWRKTLCGGIPVVIPTTTKLTTTERPRESRDSGFHYAAFSAFFVFTSKFCVAGNTTIRYWHALQPSLGQSRMRQGTSACV